MAVLNSNMTLNFKPEVAICLKLRMCSEKSPNYGNSYIGQLIFLVIQEIGITEFISDDKFATIVINGLNAHAQTLLSCLKHTALDRLRVFLNVILFRIVLFAARAL